MNESFELNHGPLLADAKFAGMAKALSRQRRIDSAGSFNHYCREACHLWQDQFGPAGETSLLYRDLLKRIGQKEKGTFVTSWGGVVVTKWDHPRVEKFLVLRAGNYFALEKHEEKDEHLRVRQGAGLLLSRRALGEPLTVQALAPENRFHFRPGMEHCIIGTDNMLLFERSIDPKGMDQDLVFIYEPDKIA